MNVVLITLLLTPFLYVFAVILSFTNAGVPSFSKEERGMAFESISDLIKNRPPIFRKKLCQSWLILAGMCIMLAVGYCRVGHIEQYTMRSDPIQFWSCIAYWSVLAVLSLFAWLRGRSKLSDDRS